MTEYKIMDIKKELDNDDMVFKDENDDMVITDDSESIFIKKEFAYNEFALKEVDNKGSSVFKQDTHDYKINKNADHIDLMKATNSTNSHAIKEIESIFIKESDPSGTVIKREFNFSQYDDPESVPSSYTEDGLGNGNTFFIPVDEANSINEIKIKQKLSEIDEIVNRAKTCNSGEGNLTIESKHTNHDQNTTHKTYQSSSEPTGTIAVLEEMQLSMKKKFKCNICDYSTSYSSSLMYHTRRHTGEKPFKCNICDYEAARKRTLSDHIRTHTGEKPFKCIDCDFSTSQKSGLIRHRRLHTGEHPFKCNICDYSSPQRSRLNDHIRTHTGDKPFKCSMCDYNAVQKSQLEAHMRTHTGEKPFQCPHCDYRAALKGNLKDHIRTHTREKPYKCGMCNYSAAQKSHLSAHMKTHTGEKPFQCIYCDYKSALRGNLRNHLRTHPLNVMTV